MISRWTIPRSRPITEPIACPTTVRLFGSLAIATLVVDVFRTVVDCAMEPRSVVAANVGVEKNKGTFNLESVSQTGESFNEAVFKTAYGVTGLGMPLRGFKSNITNLTAYTLQK